VPVRALIGFALVVAVLHLLDPRDPRTALVSEFAFEQPLLSSTAFLLLGFGVAGVGVQVLRARRWGWPGGALLVAAGLGFAALSVFPTDHRGTAPATTWVGELHDRLASTSALALTLGALLAWLALGWRGALVVLVAVNVAFWVPAVLAPDWPGLFQRSWLGAVLVCLLPLSGRAAARARARRAPRRAASSSPGGTAPRRRTATGPGASE
jgi:hypothetical protein